MPRLTSNIFLPTGCTIRSLLSGLESGGCEESKKWALSHWIMPLFQLLWPGMPNFTARYSSLCVNQSFARGRGAHWDPPPAPGDPIQPLIPQKLDHTRSLCIFPLKLPPFSHFYNHFLFFFLVELIIIFIKFAYKAQLQIGIKSPVGAYMYIFILKSIVLNRLIL